MYVCIPFLPCERNRNNFTKVTDPQQVYSNRWFNSFRRLYTVWRLFYVHTNTDKMETAILKKRKRRRDEDKEGKLFSFFYLFLSSFPFSFSEIHTDYHIFMILLLYVCIFKFSIDEFSLCDKMSITWSAAKKQIHRSPNFYTQHVCVCVCMCVLHVFFFWNFSWLVTNSWKIRKLFFLVLENLRKLLCFFFFRFFPHVILSSIQNIRRGRFRKTAFVAICECKLHLEIEMFGRSHC